MDRSWNETHRTRSTIGLILAAAAVSVALLIWVFSLRGPSSQQADDPTAEPMGPPWFYGHLNARFTVVSYADLECPFCQAYFPILRQWIDTHPEVNWQWHHLPLAFHEPAATQGARLAECAGEVRGHTAFWQTIAWVYQHTRSDGQGVPSEVPIPGLTPELQACLDSTRPDAAIQTQATEASQAGVVATPTLRLIDNHTGTDLLLPAGPIEGDALLSAIDLLMAMASETAEESATTTSEMPADVVGDMPR